MIIIMIIMTSRMIRGWTFTIGGEQAKVAAGATLQWGEFTSHWFRGFKCG